jgi:hypothetical protein
MIYKYWVIGGDYRDCRFDQIVPGTQQVSGPFSDRHRAMTEWQRLTFRDHMAATTRYVITTEARA